MGDVQHELALAEPALAIDAVGVRLAARPTAPNEAAAGSNIASHGDLAPSILLDIGDDQDLEASRRLPGERRPAGRGGFPAAASASSSCPGRNRRAGKRSLAPIGVTLSPSRTGPQDDMPACSRRNASIRPCPWMRSCRSASSAAWSISPNASSGTREHRRRIGVGLAKLRPARRRAPASSRPSAASSTSRWIVCRARLVGGLLRRDERLVVFERLLVLLVNAQMPP